MKAKITRAAVDRLEPPKTGQAWLYDSALPGFLVLAQASGRKTYLARYRAPTGRWRKLTIGNVEAMTPEAARAEARRMIEAAQLGRDPGEERRKLRQAPTVEGLRDRFMLEHGKRLKPGTRRNYEILWRRHIVPRLGSSTALVEIDGSAIQRLHDAMRETPHNANRALEVLHKAFELAKRWGWVDANPAEHVDAYPEAHRQRTLTDAELARLWDHLDRLEQSALLPAPQLVKLLILTGCRLSEIRDARWSWIDLDRGLLSLPDSKTGARDVHLPDLALAILRDLQRAQAQSPVRSMYVLPGETGGPIGGIQRMWSRIREACELHDLRLHDLRHTVGSLAHRAGMTQRQIMDLLGHRQASTTWRYVNSADEHRREAAAAWGAQVLRIAGTGPRGKASAK